MKKFTRIFLLVIYGLITFSCGSDDADTPIVLPSNILGNWQLIQDFANEGVDFTLVEISLSDCDKESTLVVNSDGSFIYNSTRDSYVTVGCETNIENGTWEEMTTGKYRLTFDEEYVQNGDAEYGDAEIKDGKLELVFDFPGGSEVNTIDKLIYDKVD